MSQTIFRHCGYEMRSHSEVMWARFMDALRVRWVYEPRTVDTRHGWYLPDFYLPACGMYLEVKGPGPDQQEIDKALDAEKQTGCPVVFCHGGAKHGRDLWFPGVMSYFTRSGAVHMSMVEICALIRRHGGDHEYARVLQSRAVEYFDGTRSLRDLLLEMIDGWMTRSDLESSKRRVHAPLNSQVEQEHRQASIAEYVAAEFVQKIKNHREKEAA